MVLPQEPFLYEFAVAHQRDLRATRSAAAGARAAGLRGRGVRLSVWSLLSRAGSPVAGRWLLLTCGCRAASSNRAAA